MYVANDSAFPLVGAFIFGELTRDDLAVMQELGAKNRKRGRHVSLIDGRRAKLPDAAMRKAIAQVMTDALAGEDGDRLVCSALVVGSTAAVGVLTALQWLAPRKQPLKYFSSAADAFSWVTSKGAPDLLFPDNARRVIARIDEIVATDASPASFGNDR